MEKQESFEQPSFLSPSGTTYNKTPRFEDIDIPLHLPSQESSPTEPEIIDYTQNRFNLKVANIVLDPMRGLAAANKDLGLAKISASKANNPDLQRKTHERVDEYMGERRGFETPQQIADHVRGRAESDFKHAQRAWWKLYRELGKDQAVERFRGHLLDVKFPSNHPYFQELDFISGYSDDQVGDKLFTHLKNLYLGKDNAIYRQRLRRMIPKIIDKEPAAAIGIELTWL